MPHRLDAVLFDLFDTLCHLDEARYLEGKRHSASRLGLDPERYLAGWLTLQERCQRGEFLTAADRIRQVCADLGREISSDLAETVGRQDEEVLLRCAMLHRDVVPTLQAIRARRDLRMALVSNASGSAQALLTPLGLEGFFDVLVFSFEVGSLKPEPAIYLTASRRLSVDPSRCLFVGDGNGRELEGAMAVGMTAVRIERSGAMEPYRRDPSRRWHHSLPDLRDLLPLLEDRQSPVASPDP